MKELKAWLAIQIFAWQQEYDIEGRSAEYYVYCLGMIEAFRSTLAYIEISDLR